MTKIIIGCDHAGYVLKAYLVAKLRENNIDVQDVGTDSSDSVDYPDYAHAVAKAVEKAEADYGILICGTANGMAISANKHQQIRCALCWDTEIGILAKQHNNANVVALPARFITNEKGWDIIQAFMNATFEGGRHLNRVNKIPC
jgi:ribose 5-phosphate isomerase B